MSDDNYEIQAHTATFKEMEHEAVRELSYGPGAFEIEGHTHDDGSKCEPLSGVTFSIMATTFDGVEHKLLFTPDQVLSLAPEMATFLDGWAESLNEPS